MKVRWVAAATQDRAEIIDYIASKNPYAALKMDGVFGESVKKLSDFPMLGRDGRVQGTRELIPHENYCIVYEVDINANTVWILALVHTSRQWPP